jgi:hypothetical protein
MATTDEDRRDEKSTSLFLFSEEMEGFLTLKKWKAS